MTPLDSALARIEEREGFSYPPGAERFCSMGQHWLRESAFRELGAGRLARDCRNCEAARDRRLAAMRAERLPMTGVDMDRIYEVLKGKNESG